jgi:ribonuclease BN (tRNA processing enzyme)
VATELVLLGTAGAPLPVAGRGGISSAVVVDGRVFVVDCGRGSPSAFADAGLDVSEVGGVAERARVRELILSHYLPARPGAVTDWAQRAGQGFSGKTTAGHDGLRRSLPL